MDNKKWSDDGLFMQISCIRFIFQMKPQKIKPQSNVQQMKINPKKPMINFNYSNQNTVEMNSDLLN